MDAFFGRYDLLVTPTMPCPPFRAGADQPGWVAGQPTEYLSWTAFTYPFNVTGQPAASVPCGRDSEGLPVGLQIVGRRGEDGLVLRAARAFERVFPWSYDGLDLV
jgi:aspartyl-tRNA(Asn)/glutamyl-tRNA(Gln) amidotransferase subunit A